MSEKEPDLYYRIKTKEDGKITEGQKARILVPRDSHQWTAVGVVQQKNGKWIFLDEINQRELPLGKKCLQIGRRPDAKRGHYVWVDNPYVSYVHAAVQQMDPEETTEGEGIPTVQEGCGVWIHDLGSKNGTWICVKDSSGEFQSEFRVKIELTLEEEQALVAELIAVLVPVRGGVS